VVQPAVDLHLLHLGAAETAGHDVPGSGVLDYFAGVSLPSSSAAAPVVYEPTSSALVTVRGSVKGLSCLHKTA